MERAKEILEEIEKLCKEYNSLGLKDKIVYERKTKGPVQDVRNIYVCEYNRDSVGLFEKIDYRETCSYANFSCFQGTEPNGYDEGMIFVEKDSSHIGIYATHSGLSSWQHWKSIGEKVYKRKYYEVNCDMHQACSLDEIRERMKEDGIIDFFEQGKANEDEIQEALKYAYQILVVDKYQTKTQEPPKSKRFSLFGRK